jgi:hypothetical protein
MQSTLDAIIVSTMIAHGILLTLEIYVLWSFLNIRVMYHPSLGEQYKLLEISLSNIGVAKTSPIEYFFLTFIPFPL